MLLGAGTRHSATRAVAKRLVGPRRHDEINRPRVTQDSTSGMPVGPGPGTRGLPVPAALALSAVLVLSLGYLEKNTPTELSFGGLYFVPVALAAWAGGLRWGIGG